MDSVSAGGSERPAEIDGEKFAAEQIIPRPERDRARCVLVLEHDALLRWAIAETLRASGHSVIEAWDAVTAERALFEAPARIDVVLFAPDFPASATFDVLGALHRVAPGHTVVMTTPDGARLWKLGALAPDARGCLVKPFEMTRLEGIVQGACG